MGIRPSKHPSREDYHPQFKNSKPGKRKKFGETVNTYLRGVFDPSPPLKYERCHLTRDGYVLVRLGLSSNSGSRSLNSAGEDLCKRIFKYRGQHLDLLTDDSILGVSACCKAWQEFLYKAFFNASLKQGPEFLEALKVNDNTSQIPAWSMVLSFAIFAGLNFSIFTSGGPSNWWEGGNVLLTSTAVETSANFLERCGYHLRTKRKATPERLTEEELGSITQRNNQRLGQQLTQTVEELEKYYNQNTSSKSKRLREVRSALFEVARVAAEKAVSNQLLRALKQKRLATVSQLAGRTEVTGVSVAPLPTWLASGPFALETATVAACANPVMALAAVGLGIYHLHRAHCDQKEKMRLDGQVKLFEDRKALVIYAWSVVSDAELLLSWVHCTEGVDPKKYLTPNGDEETANEMKDIVEQYEKMLREPPRNRQKFVEGYLQQHRQTLKSIQENLKKEPSNG